MNLYVELASALGKNATLRLLSKFGGQTLYFPKLRGRHEGEVIAGKVIRLHREGCNAVQIAGRTHLEVETVIDILESCLTSRLK